MDKVDLKKEWAGLYNATKKPALVTVPEGNFLVVHGQGDPNASDAYPNAIQALYSLSYTMKFGRKTDSDVPDWNIMPLETIWYTEGSEVFVPEEKSNWSWIAMILQPSFITVAMVAEAAAAVRRKRGDVPALDAAKLVRFDEGLSAQVLHVGPYAEETATIELLAEWIGTQGYAPRGRHHEIYLSDPGRTKPERLRTIIRQPVAPVG